MKINLAKSAGFCFGVKRAIDTALKTASSGRDVCMLGDIVHNEDVVQQIEKVGIKKIQRLSDGRNKTLLIRAHGNSLATLKKARLLGYDIVDATCPMVKEIHKIAKHMESKGCRIIIIGDKNHDEVRGIMGNLKRKAIVIDNPSHIPKEALKNIKKAAIVIQSTQNSQKALMTVAILKGMIKDMKFFNTICRPTMIKQEEMKKMPLENDVMIIIGSKTSANTKRLYEISRTLNRRSYWVQKSVDIKSAWFKNAKSAGITAGASTPDKTIQSIVNHIKGIS